MADILVNTEKLRQYAARLGQVNARIARLDSRLDGLYSKVGLLDLLRLIQADALTCYSWRLKKCQNYLNQTAADFEQAERQIQEKDPGNFSEWAMVSEILLDALSRAAYPFGHLEDPDWSQILEGLHTDLFVGGQIEKPEEEQAEELHWLAQLIGNGMTVEGALLSGSTEGAGEWLGIGMSGSADGSLFHGEAGIKTEGSWKFKNEDGSWNFDNFGYGAEAYASGAVAKGEVEGRFGLLHGKLGGEFLTGGVKGEARATLWQDGKFNPSLAVGAGAEGSVAHGETEIGLGGDTVDAHIKAEGDLLHAEAEAKAGVGYIGKDKDGKAVYGVSAEASAMAAAAQGKVQGGITIFGIDIDVGVKGYAGAAGVEAGGSISTSGVKTSLSGAAVLGAGLDISVDWSDAEWVQDTVEFVGGAAEDAGEFISDTYEAATDFLSDSYEAASEFVSDSYEAATDFLDEKAEQAGKFFSDAGDAIAEGFGKLFH